MNTETLEWTPGPWSVCWPHDNHPVGQETHVGIMQRSDGGREIIPPTRKLRMADAELIARAPEMAAEIELLRAQLADQAAAQAPLLAALKHIAIEGDRYSECDCLDADGGCLWCIAHKAAKALGVWTWDDEEHFKEFLRK